MNRRAFVGTALAVALCGTRAGAQVRDSTNGLATLRPAPSAREPFARLKDGLVDRLTPEEERERVTASPALAGPPGRWVMRASLPIARSEANWAAAWAGRIHLIGGATDPASEHVSIGWHEVYDPQADRWQTSKPLPGARDHIGIVAFERAIHIIGGRFNTFEYNTGLHHAYLADRDTWEERAPMPTARSGHGLVVYRDRFFAMGGEAGILARGGIQQAHVFGQMESYDPRGDTWQAHAAMPTPRHSVGAVAIGDWIYVAGGGAVTGGAVQSAVNEAFGV